MDIQIEPFTPNSDQIQNTLAGELGFGNYFADRMFCCDYTEGKGWHDARIKPFGNFELSPAAAVFHYGQAIFEGMKAYRREDGEVQLFRPEMNARRMAQSAARLAMPGYPEEDFVRAIHRLVDLERAWVPAKPQQSLYIRPFMIATEALQGVRPSREYLFAVLVSPVGAYYPNGFEPVRILVSESHVRAVPGGTGEAKAAGNYAGSLVAGAAAKAADCDQILWLDAIERRYVEEIGAMNVCFVIDDTLVTPPLQGSILPGVTRMSLLELAREDGLKVEERRIDIQELCAALQAGRCTEAFGCGTAAVITPIKSFVYRGESIEVPKGSGPVANRYFQRLTDLQWGRIPDERGWTQIVPQHSL